ncbi:MAG: acyl carrier protein [Sphingomonadales bacterium]|nr:acyl carrier protein [Sphingomonadales bacterium]
MNESDIRNLIFDVLSGIAPEADPTKLAGTVDLRAALDLDSMDFLNFVIALSKRISVNIPEADYPKLFTLNGAIAYLAK